MKIKACFFGGILSLFYFSCQNNTDQTNLKIIKPTANFASCFLLNNSLDTIQEVTFDSGKNFTFTLDLPKEDYFSLNFVDTKGTPNLYTLYLKPKEQLTVQLDSSGLKFAGDGAERNDFLANRFFTLRRGWNDKWAPQWKKVDKVDFYRDSLYKKYKRQLNTLEKDSLFYKRTRIELELLYANFLLDNKGALPVSVEKELDVLLSEQQGNKLLNSSIHYLNFLSSKYVKDFQFTEQKLEDILNGIEKDKLKKYLISSMLKEFNRFGTRGLNENGEILKHFTEQNERFKDLPELKSELLQKRIKVWEKWRNAIGKKVNFSYREVNGKTINLQDFKGKYVYIDFWATWCGWCIQEFPSLDRLKERFKDKNIAFISISVDMADKIDVWKKMVRDKNLKGIQLIAPQSKEVKLEGDYNGINNDKNKDLFIKTLDVNSFMMGLPHFALISPEGLVVDPSAIRPSNPQIDSYLHKYVD